MRALKINSRIFHFIGNEADCKKLQEAHLKSDLISNSKTRITEIVDLGDSYNGWINFETWAVFTWLTSYEFTDNGADIQKMIRVIVNTDYSKFGYSLYENLGIIAVRLERIVFSNKNLWCGLFCDLTDYLYFSDCPEKYKAKLYTYFRENNKIVWVDVINALKECS